tara:strand:+ start:64 stop:885 length:822 start_codon:yes stop_codon:yes gene_type:complete
MKKFNSMNELLVHYCEILLSSKEVSARNSKQKEIIFENFELTDPTNIDINLSGRKFNKNYAVAEWLWYASANPSSKNIGKLAKIWKIISDDHQQVESNYGVYLKPQWNWVKNEIINDLDTRRATFVINQPYHKYKNISDYPCTQYIQFFVRENKLHIGVNMRSNDLIYGLCNDVFTFSLFQQMMLNELNQSGLNLEIGSYFHFAGSLHIYDHHYEMAKNICNSIDKPTETCRLNEGVNWNLVDENFPFPITNIEKSEIYDYVQKCSGEIFKNG